MCTFSITYMSLKVNIDGQQVELDDKLPHDQAVAKAKAQAALKSRLIKGTVTGGGIALGAAGTEVALAGAAEAASAVATVAEGIALAPIIITGGLVAGAFFGIKYLMDQADA